MQGNIDFSGTLSGSIAAGGGGSDVTITPTLQSGTKIADFSIDEVEGSLYAPTPENLPDTIVTKAIRKYNDDTQTKIMTVTTFDTENNQEVNQDIYAPSPVQCWYTPGLEQDYQIGQFTYGGVTQNVYIPYFQRPLTAGTNITIDSVTNTISASNGSVDYSTTEKLIGTWTDGKPLYQKTIEESFTTSNQQVVTISGVDSTMDCKNYKGRFDYEYNNVFYSSALGANLNMYPADDFSKLKVLSVMTGTFRIRVIITLEYTKTTD